MTGPNVTPSAPAFLAAQSTGVRLAVKLQPRASTNEICEALGNELKIKVTAPPVDAAANEALVKLLAGWLDCPRNRVELIRGHTSRHKTLMLHGFKLEDIQNKFRGATSHPTVSSPRPHLPQKASPEPPTDGNPQH